MDPIREHIDQVTRRHFFGRAGLGLGTAALSTLLAESARSANTPTPAATPAHARARLSRGACPTCPTFRPRRNEPFICI